MFEPPSRERFPLLPSAPDRKTFLESVVAGSLRKAVGEVVPRNEGPYPQLRSAKDRSGVLPDWMIDAGAVYISPYVDHLDETGRVSYGLCSSGYDARLGDEVWLIENRHRAELAIDPKNFDPRLKQRLEKSADGIYVMPPYSFVLSKTLEYFALPRDVKGRVMGKSTYARCGAQVLVTPLEPGWHGEVTIEIVNSTPHRLDLYPGEGVMQIEFEWLVSPCSQSYADRKGKYQGQVGVTAPFVKARENLGS